MNKVLIAASVVLFLTSLFLVVKAQENLASDALSILIITPGNKIYTVNSLILDIQVEAKTNPQSFLETSRLVTYSLDAQAEALTEDRYYNFINSSQSYSIAKYAASLKELPDGQHNLTVYVKYTIIGNVYASNATVYFSIDTAPKHTPTTNLPVNNSYLPKFPTPQPTSTLELSTSNSPTQQPTFTPTQPPYPTEILVGANPFPLIMGIVIVILAAVIGVVVYFKRIRKQKSD
jgi:hypothetical protein